MTFGGPRVDDAIAKELLRAVEPMAIEAALEAERMQRERQDEQQRLLALELQQARYEATLAERRYAACDPDNRLIAAQLEKNWEVALCRVQDLQARQSRGQQETVAIDPGAFDDLAERLSEAWHATGVTMRARQQLLRSLIVDIVADVDDEAREVVLTIHWRGGQHSELRVKKPQAGEHGCATTEDALAVMRTMAGRGGRGVAQPDGHADRPRQDLDCEAGRSVRRVRNIHAYQSATKAANGLTEAARTA